MTIAFGTKLRPSVDIPEETLNQLFATLFLTQLFVFLGGNLIARQQLVFEHSGWIALVCVQVAAVFYMLARTFRSAPWGLLTTYGFLLLMVYSSLGFRREFGLLAGFVGLLYALRFVRVPRAHISAIFLIAALTSLVILGTRNAYTSFSMMSRLNAGEVTQDTLFHASIAAMIKNYGIVSTGLHGLVETPYHALSHALMASISLVSSQSVVETYGVANWILFAPILILAITAICAALDTEKKLSIPLTWALVALVLLFAPHLLGRWAVWDSYFVSESYLVSLGLLMLALPVLFKLRLTVFDLTFVLISGLLISSAKSTVGLIYAGLWLTRLLFVRGDRPSFDFFGFGLSSASAGAVVFASAQAHSNAVIFRPFHFLSYSANGDAAMRLGEMIRHGVPVASSDLVAAISSIVFFGLLHFLFTWIVVVATIFRFGVRRVFQDPITVYSCAAAAAGILAAACFEVAGGAAYYISNVAFFVAMPGVIAYTAAALPRTNIPLYQTLAFLLVAATIGSFGAIRDSISRVNQDERAPKNQVMQGLLALSTASPVNTAYRYNKSDFTDLPVRSCTAQPFFFPAVSERVWIDVIRPQDNCEFAHYSYEQYGLRPDHQKVIASPRLASGMKVVDFEPRLRERDHAGN